MINNNPKIGIIGAGYMAEQYLRVLLKKKIFCEAIYSRTYSKSESLKKKYKIKKNCKSLAEFKSLKCINGLIIAVNDVSTFYLLKNIKIDKYKILCEKPVGVSFAQTSKIGKILKKKSCKFYVGLNRRFYSSTLEAIKLINKNRNKRIIYINDQQLQNTGNLFIDKNVMYCNSVHLIDYIKIFARGNLKKIIRIKKFKNYLFSQHISRLIFSSNDEVLYTCNWNSPGSWSINVIQKNLRCEISPLENLSIEKLEKNKRKKFHIKKSKLDKNFKPGLYLQTSEFIKLLKNKKHKLLEFKKYFQTVKLINKIYA